MKQFWAVTWICLMVFSSVKTEDVPTLTLLSFMRENSELLINSENTDALGIYFYDDDVIIPDDLTEDDVSFTFQTAQDKQHSEKAIEVYQIIDELPYYYASFNATGIKGFDHFNDAFQLVGELSIHNGNDSQDIIASGSTSFEMPAASDVPLCSSPYLWTDAPLARLECTNGINDTADYVIVTMNDSDVLNTTVTNVMKDDTGTIFYLQLDGAIEDADDTTLYVCVVVDAVNVCNPSNDTVTFLSLTGITITQQDVKYEKDKATVNVTFDNNIPKDSEVIVVSENTKTFKKTTKKEPIVSVELKDYETDKRIDYFITDLDASSTTGSIDGYDLSGEAMSASTVEVRWLSSHETETYTVEDSIDSKPITLTCTTNPYCFVYFIGLDETDDYRVTLIPPTDTNTTITSAIIPPYEKAMEIHVQDVQLDWSNDLSTVEIKICFQQQSTTITEADETFEGVIVNSEGEWRRGQGLGKDSKGNLCLKPLVLDTESFSVRGQMTVIVLKRAQDGRTLLASGETRMFFHK